VSNIQESSVSKKTAKSDGERTFREQSPKSKLQLGGKKTCGASKVQSRDAGRVT